MEPLVEGCAVTLRNVVLIEAGEVTLPLPLRLWGQHRCDTDLVTQMLLKGLFRQMQRQRGRQSWEPSRGRQAAEATKTLCGLQLMGLRPAERIFHFEHSACLEMTRWA